MKVFIKRLSAQLVVACLLVACQAASPTGSAVQTPTPEVSAPFPTPQPNVTSQLPSPAPSTAAPGEVSSFPQLMLSTSQLCVGEPLTIGLVASPFNRSLIPISLQKSPPASAATNEVGGNKQPPTPYEDTVLLGDILLPQNQTQSA